MKNLRVCAHAGLAMAALLSASVLCGSAYGQNPAPDLSGVYWATRYNAKIQGDTLVIETAGYNETTFVDATGAQHTAEMRTIERVRKISPTQIEIVITIHDPEIYTQDWQARFVYNQRNDVRLEDYVCGEPHRDISGVEGVRRP